MIALSVQWGCAFTVPWKTYQELVNNMISSGPGCAVLQFVFSETLRNSTQYSIHIAATHADHLVPLSHGRLGLTAEWITQQSN